MTRADFWIACTEWLGSTAFDGYPERKKLSAGGGVPDTIVNATTELEFRNAVLDHLTGRRGSTIPPMHWPWPWESSLDTCCVYSFFPGMEGQPGRVVIFFEDEDDEHQRSSLPKNLFPNMDTSHFREDHDGSGAILVTRDGKTGRVYIAN